MAERTAAVAALAFVIAGCQEPTVAIRAEPLPLSPALATVPEPVSRTVEEARRVADLQRRLRTTTILESVGSDPPTLVVPPEAGATLQRLEDASLEVADLFLADMPHDRRPSVREALVGAFEQAGVRVDDPRSEALEEADLILDLRRLDDHPSRWAFRHCVFVGLGTACLLAVYERHRADVRRVLVTRPPRYETGHDMQMGLAWAVSPPDGEGDFHVVTAYTVPWMASCWRGVRYVALVPTDDPERPRRVVDRDKTAYWCQAWGVDASVDGFAFRYHGWAGVDDVFARREDVWRRAAHGFRLVRDGVRLSP